jgi:hypothetical protein
MPSIIIMTEPLGDTDEIPNTPAQHTSLKAGMKFFGSEYKARYIANPPTNKTFAAQLLFSVFKAVRTKGFIAYLWDNDDTRFYEIRLKDNAPSGSNIFFVHHDENGTMVNGKNFKIMTHIDGKQTNQHMNVTIPVGDPVSYLPLFNHLAAEDYTGANIAIPVSPSTDFFAAATLISRCK